MLYASTRKMIARRQNMDATRTMTPAIKSAVLFVSAMAATASIFLITYFSLQSPTRSSATSNINGQQPGVSHIRLEI
jgi:hypothetical protein